MITYPNREGKRNRLTQILRAHHTIDRSTSVAYHYARLRVIVERAGTPIGSNDLLIASPACALGLTLVTGNLKEFSPIPGLPVENWLE